jgi:hypothetical protein
MRFNNTKHYDPPKRKRILISETVEEENTRLAKEIAALLKSVRLPASTALRASPSSLISQMRHKASRLASLPVMRCSTEPTVAHKQAN